ncbi:MAG: (d)CMP kinase [Ekhidna sp.]|nr:(d)CMP kinase [Ekhidna sp.]
MRKIIITLDGYSGTGKSSTARIVSEKLGYTYIDSGAMYRAVTYHFLNENINLKDTQNIERILRNIKIKFRKGRTFLNGQDVEDVIRSMAVNQYVSQVAAISAVRVKLVQFQRKLGEEKGVVMDGRDIGTVVFPNADLKLFMTADMDIRVERRKNQLLKKGIKESFDDIRCNFIKRDKIDTTREDSPLMKAEDAVEIDTTDLSLNDQVNNIVKLAENLIYEN